MTLMQFVLMCLYLALPGAVANMMPVFVSRVPFLNIPVDLGYVWRGKRLFGSHKTYRGFFFGVFGAMAAAYVQSILFQYPLFRAISFVDFSQISFLLFGFLIGFGALFGDLVKSFFKRRAGIEPGKSWFPWDQLDLLFGALLFVSFIKVPSLAMILFYLISVPLLHIFFNHLGYWLKIKETKW